jgi:ubiquitin-like domain-containing CTD phosphatase 1
MELLCAPRPGKKALVLDIDYTLFDLSSSAEKAEELARPYLHEFLAHAHQWYDVRACLLQLLLGWCRT